uniref:Uncharacterized protein n=1 Tax=Macaca mulatta TaxID=9544 RepID=A0A5F8AIJ6_MACMU
LSIPFLIIKLKWTTTNTIYILGMYCFSHTVRGVPATMPREGRGRLRNTWEKTDIQRKFSSCKMFCSVSSVVLYFHAFYIKYDYNHFFLNTEFVLSINIGKMLESHGFRVFGRTTY